MASNFVNLNEVGVLTHSGQQYGGNAEDQGAEARNFLGRMESVQPGLRGSAGNTFQGVSYGTTSNLTQLANLIADQAIRAVRTEDTLVTSDDDAHAAQQVTLSAVDSHTSALARGINA